MSTSGVQAIDTNASQITDAQKRFGRRSHKNKLEAREARDFWLLISPWVIGFILFTGGPVVASFILSFTDYTGTSSAPNFIGLQNYTSLFADSIFLKSLAVTTYYVVLSVPLALIGSLLLALLLNQRVRFLGVFRTIYYMPTVIAGVALSLLWQWIFNPDLGIANYLLNLLHLPSLLWFQDESTVIPSFVLMSLWGLGGPMIVFLASLQGIPPELYEAASLDGSNGWHKFRYVTIPMISPAILLNLVTGVIGAFQIFVQGYVITQGGPNFASEFYVLYLFNNAFQYFKFGYAASQAWILFVIILALTIAMLQISRRLVYYEA
ncbi:carbohydrate ABC transporter permease [Dictyobacter aurantiacus]|uniref:Spermidine/putrescine ABC transporter permease n=1 Tax=Dictyobacter aurantiacus TaxID=1936993 RepID=A0A401ZQ77_9CHLR|nr:sugar ABC transporter permease [Dictyobacter aurantiacus]GCE09027.1 spermidine/putrescine ABC transporter permease [Dictyobacter aurantiacus]